MRRSLPQNGNLCGLDRREATPLTEAGPSFTGQACPFTTRPAPSGERSAAVSLHVILSWRPVPKLRGSLRNHADVRFVVNAS
jgi:hypothetical protein